MREIKLTKNDEKIFEEIKRLVKLNQKHTCAQIAEQIGTAPSSIIKLAKKMGYSGWNEMYYSLSRIYSDAVPLSINNFDFLSEGKIFEKTRQLMELLQAYKDRKIVIGCVGDSEFLTNYLLDKLVGMALCVLPELAACLWEAFCILHRPGDYIFCTTQLHDPSSVLLDRGSFTLTGVIDDADGSHIAVRTHPIFLSHGFGALRMEEYTDKTVTVGWNRKTDSVVVIG